MAYDIEKMTDIVELYLNELPQRGGTADEQFTKYEVVNMLNRAQKKVCSLIHPDLLSALETSDLNKALTVGVYALSGLTAVPLLMPMGIVGVKITDGAFCERMNFETFKSLTNQDKTYDADKPRYLNYAESITVYPTSATNADFYYLKEPTDMDYDTGADCGLSDEIQEVILDYAAYIGFLYMKSDPRSQNSFDAAIMTINAMNARVDPDFSKITSATREAYLDYNDRSVLTRITENDREVD